MSIMMDEEIKRWTAKRRTALVMDIIQGKTSVSKEPGEGHPPTQIKFPIKSDIYRIIK